MSYTTLVRSNKNYISLNPNLIVDGSFDIAYEELAHARANLIRAGFANQISEEDLHYAVDFISEERDSVGTISPQELNELIARYSKQNKEEIYNFGSLRIECK